VSASIFVGRAKPPANAMSGQMYTILSVVCVIWSFRDMTRRYGPQVS
jgi:hypothetical protein